MASFILEKVVFVHDHAAGHSHGGHGEDHVITVQSFTDTVEGDTTEMKELPSKTEEGSDGEKEGFVHNSDVEEGRVEAKGDKNKQKHHDHDHHHEHDDHEHHDHSHEQEDVEVSLQEGADGTLPSFYSLCSTPLSHSFALAHSQGTRLCWCGISSCRKKMESTGTES